MDTSNTSNTSDFTQIGSIDAETAVVDLNMPIPEKRKDPVIEYRRFLKTELLEEWQRTNPHYCIFTTEFHPCKEEGYDVAIYVTCGDIKAFNEHNSMVDKLLELRQAALYAKAEADPDVVTEPPVEGGLYHNNPDVVSTDIPANEMDADVVTTAPAEDDTDMSAPDPAEPVVKSALVTGVGDGKK